MCKCQSSLNFLNSIKNKVKYIITAHIRRMMRGYVFTRIYLLTRVGKGQLPRLGGGTHLPADGGGTTYLTANLGYGGYPHWTRGTHLGWGRYLPIWGYPRARTEWGYPLDRTGWGLPLPQKRRQWITCYTASGMPLAFTQGDFLVF